MAKKIETPDSAGSVRITAGWVAPRIYCPSFLGFAWDLCQGTMTQVCWTRYTATTLANTGVYRCFARYTKRYRSLRPLHFGVLFAVRILNMLP